MRDHKRLRAFELADELTLLIYKITKSLPKEEIYGLTAQMRRASVSVTSNIVEGCSRSSQSECCRFLEIAFGSLKELHYQFDLALRLGYFANDGNNINVCTAKLEEAEKVLSSLIKAVKPIT